MLEVSELLALEAEAHLWLTAPEVVARSERIDEIWAMLSDDERRQYDRYRVERAREQHLAARALVRTTLSRYADVDPADWRFTLNEHGRPEIDAPSGLPPIRFNLSHTDGLVACLVALVFDVGVDVEDTRRMRRLLGIANHSFSPLEVEDLSNRRPGERRDRFYTYWTLKESYIKARGLGLALPLKKFSFTFPHDGEVSVRFDAELDDREEDWQFGLYKATSHHMLACAVRRGSGPDLRLVTRRVEPLGGAAAPGELRFLARSTRLPL